MIPKIIEHQSALALKKFPSAQTKILGKTGKHVPIDNQTHEFYAAIGIFWWKKNHDSFTIKMISQLSCGNFVSTIVLTKYRY